MIRRTLQTVRSYTLLRYLRGSKFVGAGALIFDEAGRILLIKSRLRGTWEYPGGGSHGSETPLETCRREVREETGIDIGDYRLVGVVFWRRLTPNGNLLFTFAATVDHKAASHLSIQRLEVTDACWVTRERALELVPERIARRLVPMLTAYDDGGAAYVEG